MTHSTQPISPLRQRMIEDMTMRKLSPRTQGTYIRVVANFTRFLTRSPDTAGAEDLRRYQLHLVEQGVSSTSINANISGLKLFFESTLDRPEVMRKMRHNLRTSPASRDPERRRSHAAVASGWQSQVPGRTQCGLRCRFTCQRDRPS